MAGTIKIREARPEDNQVLIELQFKCLGRARTEQGLVGSG